MNTADWLGWIATGLLLTGYYLNAKQVVYSWIVWFFGNSLMFMYAIFIESYSLAFLSIVLVFLNIFGWRSWRKKNHD